MPPQQPVRARQSLETAALWALVATVIAALIILIPSASIPFGATKTFVLAGGALVTLALFILARLSRGNVILPPSALVGALWLPAIAYLLSAAFSGGSFSAALWGTALEPDTLGLVLASAFLGTLAALAVRRQDQFRTFFTAAGWAFGFIVAVQTIILLVGQVAPNTVSPALSIIGSSSDLALVLGLGVISTLLTLRFLEVSSRNRWLLIAAGAVSLFLLAVLNSSLVWVLVALVALGLFVEAIMKRRGASADSDLDDAAIVSESETAPDASSHSFVMPLVALAVALFFLIGGTLGNALASALHVSVLNVTPSWQSTWNVASHVYSSSPVFGSGPGTFGAEWLKYRNASLNSTVFWNLDFSSGIGFIPTSLATTGIVGLLAWLGFLGLFLVLGLRMLILRAPADAYARYAATLSFVGMAYVFTGAIFGLPGSVVLALGFVFAGLFASLMRYGAGKSQWGIIFSRSPRIGFAVVFGLTLVLLVSVVAAYALVERYVANVELARATSALSSGNLDAAASAANASLSFAQTSTAYQVQAAVALGQMNQVAASSTIAATDAQKAFQTALSNGINAALTATRVDPNNYQNWLALGNLYAQAVPLKVEGAYDSAKTAYDKAAALSPTNPQIPYIVAQLDIANGDAKSAEDALKQAVSLKQDYTAAIFLLSQLYVQDGNVKDALASAEAAAYFTPNDPNVLFQVGVLRAASNDLPGAAAALEAAVAANAQFANARYFLAAVLAKQGDTKDALTQMQAIAALSDQNAQAVQQQIAQLEAGKNPFPANLLTVSPTTPSSTGTGATQTP